MSVHIVTNIQVASVTFAHGAVETNPRCAILALCSLSPPALVAFQTLPSTHSVDMTSPIEQSKRAICCLKNRLRATWSKVENHAAGEKIRGFSDSETILHEERVNDGIGCC